jgi:hypothetical protein
VRRWYVQEGFRVALPRPTACTYTRCTFVSPRPMTTGETLCSGSFSPKNWRVRDRAKVRLMPGPHGGVRAVGFGVGFGVWLAKVLA